MPEETAAQRIKRIAEEKLKALTKPPSEKPPSETSKEKLFPEKLTEDIPEVQPKPAAKPAVKPAAKPIAKPAKPPTDRKPPGDRQPALSEAKLVSIVEKVFEKRFSEIKEVYERRIEESDKKIEDFKRQFSEMPRGTDEVTPSELNEIMIWICQPEYCDLQAHENAARATINRVRAGNLKGKSKKYAQPYNPSQYLSQPYYLLSQFRKWRKSHPDIDLLAKRPNKDNN